MSRSNRTGTLTGPSSPRPVLTGGSCATLSWISKRVHGRGAIRQDLPGEVFPAAQNRGLLRVTASEGRLRGAVA